MGAPDPEALENLAGLTLCASAAAIESGRFTAQALAEAYLQRIRKHENRVRAWAWLDEARMLHEARRADEALRAGARRGPLHGIPVGIKDIIHTEAIPTRMGSPIYDAFVPPQSATCVQRLQQAGAYVQGKTVTTEFATRQPGPTTNPWDPHSTPGGSSSGSAAAVAAWFTAGAVGTQTRGSIIRPAAYCGVVGFKPSFGMVSRQGTLRLSSVLDHVGVLARDVDDAALLCAAMAGEDGDDASTTLPRRPGLTPVETLAASPRLAVIRTAAWDRADGAQKEMFVANCRQLDAAGAELFEVELPAAFSEADRIATTLQLHDISRNFAAVERHAADRMSESFRDSCRQGADITDAQYREALDQRQRLQPEFERLVSGFDAVVTPSATGEAPPTLSTTGDPAFCTIWTLLGLPCVSIPSGRGPRGLPMGLQIVARHLHDGHALSVAKWCARRLPFDPTPPPF